MSKEKIAVDIDDVLSSSTDAVRVFVNSRFGVDLDEQHYRIEAEYWGYYESVWAQHGIDESSLMDDFHGGLTTDQSSISPVKGAPEAWKRLSQKYDLQLITSRPKEMQLETELWLKEHLDPVLVSPIFLGFGQSSSKTKGEVCAELGIHYLIDDNINHCRGAAARGITAILFGDYGWQYRVAGNLVRCKNWAEVGEYFNV
jgi:uncharacterized HAD superfamily protein